MAVYVAAGLIIFIAIIHSVLGEREILTPLFEASWEVNIPRFAMERILRFAWHLTSIAWVMLGCAALGFGILEALGVCALTSAAVIFVMLRGHLAWPLFLVSGGASLLAAERLPAEVFMLISASAALTCLSIAGVHVYWALGGRRGIRDALPQAESGGADHAPLMHPPQWLTALVALGLAIFGGSLLWALWAPAAWWLSGLIGLGGVIFGLRSVGDGKYVGLTKTIRGTRFARLDDQLYTPISVLLSLGCFGVWFV